jgi:peptide/nickel transport system substrate-binding protein
MHHDSSESRMTLARRSVLTGLAAASIGAALAAHTSLRGNGATGWAGWPDSPRLEALRRDWMAAGSLAEQQRIAREMQPQAWIDVPYVPLGQNRQPTAYRSDLTGLLQGFPTFWNIRRA